MSFATKIIGWATNSGAEVDANNQLLVTTNQDPTKAGAVRLYDADGAPIAVEENGALSVSQDELILSEQVDGTALNINKWATSTSTMTIAQAGGFITLNAGASIASGAYAIINSIMNVPLYGDMPVEFSFNAKINVQPQSNITIEMGFGTASGVTAPTDGAFFRWTSTGGFVAVVSYGGAETAVTCVGSGNSTCPPPSNDTELYSVVIAEDHVQFLIDDELVADVPNPMALAYPVSAGHQPVYARVYNGGNSPSQAPQLSIGQVLVRQISVNLDRPWRDAMAAQGMGLYQSPITPFAQTANHANSTSPVSATLSNTTAGYTTLGGKFQFAAVIGAATDFALFAYQVPSPFKLYVTSVSISSMVTGAAVVTATILDWSLGVNSSAASLATTDSAGAWASRRLPIGLQGMVATAVIGAQPPDLTRRFDPPLVVDSNRFLHLILQIPSGAATSSLVFRGNAMITGYFE